MTSIRSRTSLLVAASMTALLLVGGIGLFVVLRHALTAQFDEALTTRADVLRSITYFDGSKVEMDFAREAMPRFAEPRGRPEQDVQYFVAWISEGEQGVWRVLERSGSLSGREWLADADLPAGVHDVDLPGEDARAGRAVMTEFTAAWESDEERTANPHAVPPRVRVLIAAPRASLDRVLATVAWSIAGMVGVISLGSAVAFRWAVGRGLTPVRDLSRGVAAIGPDTLHASFEIERLPSELRPVGEQLSALLARLRAAFERERRFTAAASHELRTPISELRMLLEVAMSQPRSSAEWTATGERALGVLDRAQSLCESLLSLSRAESSRSGCAVEPIEVAPILADQAARAVALHGADARRLCIDCPAGLTARANAAALVTIMGNLFDNALRHGNATPQRPAACIARGDSDGVTISVSNHAPTLSPADVPRLFEPFWQADASRSRQSGFGLGLSLCRALAEACGGDIRGSLDEDQVLSLVVRLNGRK